MSNSDNTPGQFSPGDVVAGRYVVRAQLGTGGLGTVYSVADTELEDVEIALKVLHPHLVRDEDAYSRFRNELAVARSLSHPSIVRLFDIGRLPSGIPFITMELVRGDTLSEHILRASKMMSVEAAAAVLLQTSRAMAYAHGQGVVHRDLKPSNIMLTEEQEVKVLDFGTARLLSSESNLTQTGQLVGTPDYMSPEQVEGKAPDAACDIYALGIIGFECVNGSKPFVGESLLAVAYQHVHKELPVFPAADVPRWYENLIREACKKDVSERLTSMQEMAARIEAAAPALRQSLPDRVSVDAEASTLGRTTVIPNAFGADADDDFGWGSEISEITSAVEEQREASEPNSQLQKTTRVRLIRAIPMFVILALLGLSSLAALSRYSPRGSSLLSSIVARVESAQGARFLGIRRLFALPDTEFSYEASSKQENEELSQRTELLSELLEVQTALPDSLPLATDPEQDTESRASIGVAKVEQEAVAASSINEIRPEEPAAEEVASLETPSEKRTAAPPVQLPEFKLSLDRTALTQQHRWLKWELRAFPEGEEGNSLREQFLRVLRLNVISLGEHRIRERIQVGTRHVKRAAGQELILSGRIARPREIGAYRVDLLIDGEVSGSKEFAVVGLEAAEKSVKGPITIINQPSYVPESRTTLIRKRLGAATNQEQSERVAEESDVEELPINSSEKRITLGGECRSSGAERVHSFKIELKEEGSSFRGSGTFGTLGAVTVSGRKFERGIELTLSAREVRIRFIGTLRSGSFRGRYVIPVPVERGMCRGGERSSNTGSNA